MRLRGGAAVLGRVCAQAEQREEAARKEILTAELRQSEGAVVALKTAEVCPSSSPHQPSSFHALHTASRCRHDGPPHDTTLQAERAAMAAALEQARHALADAKTAPPPKV